jgi:hypothetical protein
MEPEPRCGKPCQQRFMQEPCCPNMCQRPLGHGEGIALPAALGHLEHCNCLADHQPIQRVTSTHRLGDKCYHVRSWRQGKVIELPEGDHMRIEFDKQQKKTVGLAGVETMTVRRSCAASTASHLGKIHYQMCTGWASLVNGAPQRSLLGQDS